MIPRNSHVGTNSTTLDASYGDPATIALSAEIRLANFTEALRQSWWNLATCRGAGVDLFHDPKRTAEALQLCGRCEALEPCRTEAVADPRLDHGIRGGMDVAARKNARRQPQDRREHPVSRNDRNRPRRPNRQTRRKLAALRDYGQQIANERRRAQHRTARAAGGHTGATQGNRRPSTWWLK
jgi:hypothetical protein